ncbi:hypothetical protein, partial [Bifidobacterium sp. UTBIF-68]|uniref:hypothetical protein n=1 Tax=Bifidobacterium sp. UTBIF-68 TaxID=1465262 RepID=UPI001C611DCA
KKCGEQKAKACPRKTGAKIVVLSALTAILWNLHKVCHIAGMPTTMKRPQRHMVAMRALPGELPHF